MQDRKLGIFCAGNLGREIYDIAIRINEIEHRWQEIVFVDNDETKSEYYGQKVYRLADFKGRQDEMELVVANGEPQTKKEIYLQIKQAGFHLTNLMDPTAIISPTATIGEGVIVTPYSTINSNVTIGDNVLVQSYVRVGHDIKAESHCVISANTAIGGATIVGEGAFIGMGAAIKEELHIGEYAIVGMGAVVYKDVAAHAVVIGNPARETKGNRAGKVFQ
ncbi:MAG: acetyltransferase [Eubacterium sp.]|nr:acetyltransferase [Eubacterium sp.]